jgi:putative ABC transport system permease protein
LTTGGSAASFIDYQQRGAVFESVAVSASASFNLTGQGEPERVEGRRVSSGYFTTRGVTTALGRAFLPDEDKPGNQYVALISYGLWQRRFNADPNALGSNIMLNGENHTVVGVMPEAWSRRNEIWTPLALTPEQLADRGKEFLRMTARLKPGVSLEQAQAVMNTLALQLMQEHPQNYPADSGWNIRLTPVYEDTVREIRPALRILLGAVGFILLIACANVANLLLARMAARGREMALRAALGASRQRALRQLLAESLLLALAGGGMGLLIAYWGTGLLINLNQNNLPRAQEYSMDGRILAFAFGLSVLTSLLFGLAPALQASKADLIDPLKEGGRGAGGAGRAGLRSLLVVAEIALTLVLLIGGGLMLKSFAQLLQVNPGFLPENLLTLRISLPNDRYHEERQVRDFARQALEKVKALSGVQAAGVVTSLPLSQSDASGTFAIDGRPTASRDARPQADWRMVSPEYLQTMGIPLQAGRYFTERDTADAPNVMLIDETLARLYWPNENPIGKRVALSDTRELIWREIIGVVGAVKHRGLDADYRGTLYAPHSQKPWENLFLVARTAAEPTSMTTAVRAAIQSVDQNQPVYEVMTMEQRVSESVGQRRFSMLLLGLFAAVALLLAALGLYGVMSYGVSQRTQEIGIRMALGAQASDVLKLVVKQGMTLVCLGVGIGLLVSFALTRLLTSLLFGVQATDPVTIAGVALMLVGVALLACWIPARRATKVDPLVALRHN